jgi:hypothetical protein
MIFICLKYIFVYNSSKAYYSLDENEREILKRERRRLQEQLRRVKRNEERYNQYEKQQMLLQIQQQNLALIQSNQPLLLSPTQFKRSNLTQCMCDNVFDHLIKCFSTLYEDKEKKNKSAKKSEYMFVD